MSKMSNEEVAEAFANGETVGCNSNGTLMIAGDTIYSYGKHWPIAKREGGNFVAVNYSSYGKTTSKQTGLVAAACAKAGLGVRKVELEEIKSLCGLK